MSLTSNISAISDFHSVKKQAEKLKSCEMKEGWMKCDEGWMKNDERWRINDAVWWFQAVEGFWFMTDRQTDKRTDICDCRVAFATEKGEQSWNIPFSEKIRVKKDKVSWGFVYDHSRTFRNLVWGLGKWIKNLTFWTHSLEYINFWSRFS